METPPEGAAEGKTPPIPFELSAEEAVPIQIAGGDRRTWPPEGAIQAIISIRADRLHSSTRASGDVGREEPFAGSLMDGIDIKATLRSRARGEPTIYVRDNSRRSSSAFSVWHSPTVFILRPEGLPGAELFINSGYARSWRSLVGYPHRLDEVISRFGYMIIDGMTYHESVTTSPEMAHAGIDAYRICGEMTFSQFHFDGAEEARWAEATDYRRILFANDTSPEGIAQVYAQRFGLSLDPGDWASFLILGALPFAESFVNVIAPEGFAIPRAVRVQAARLGKELFQLPLSMFPADLLDRVAVRHHCRPLDNESGEYSELTVRAMGERGDALRELLPAAMRCYGRTPGGPK